MTARTDREQALAELENARDAYYSTSPAGRRTHERELRSVGETIRKLDDALAASLSREQRLAEEHTRAVRVAEEYQAREQALREENERWLKWSGGAYPDDSPGDVIHALSDGTITLDDGITTWNPLRALAWIERRREENAGRALRSSAEEAVSPGRARGGKRVSDESGNRRLLHLVASTLDESDPGAAQALRRAGDNFEETLRELAASLAREQALSEALRWYAEERHYTEMSPGGWERLTYADRDAGSRARAALRSSAEGAGEREEKYVDAPPGITLDCEPRA